VAEHNLPVVAGGVQSRTGPEDKSSEMLSPRVDAASRDRRQDGKHASDT